MNSDKSLKQTKREPLPVSLARGLIRIISELITLSVITFFLLMFLYASWSLYDAQRIYGQSDSKVYETYKPEADIDDSPTFAELQVLNPDVLGWITIYGTGVDYPLVQGDTNDSYINTDVQGRFSLGGSIFLDWQNEKDFSDFNTIIYGHHVEKGEMFGDLEHFMEQAYFDKHEYGNLYYGGKNHGLHVFAMVHGNAYDFKLYNPKVEEENRQSYLDYIDDLALYKRDIGVTKDDHIVFLSTCASELSNARYIVIGKICDETFVDPFPVETKQVVERIVQGTDMPFLKTLPSWWIYVFVAFVCLILLSIAVGVSKAIKHKKQVSLRREDTEQVSTEEFSDKGGYNDENEIT